MKKYILIPARMESSRLPNKPLKEICGIPMIVHTALRSSLVDKVDHVVVCTDSTDIVSVCERYNISVCLTKSSHMNGTERIEEASRILEITDDDLIIDVQGDEPLVTVEQINQVYEFLETTNYNCVVPFQYTTDTNNPNRVKMITYHDRIIAMSRSDIPYSFSSDNVKLKKHLSIIGFRLDGLKTYVQTESTEIENLERIELMRLIEIGYPIGTFEQNQSTMSVDTVSDYENVCRAMERDQTYNYMKGIGLI